MVQQNNKEQQESSLLIWEKIVSIFSIPSQNEILNYKQQSQNNIENNLKPLFNNVRLYKLESLVLDWYFESIKKYFKSTLSNEFWKFFNNVNLAELDSSKTSGRELKFINHQFALSISLLHKVFSYFKFNLFLFYELLFKNESYNFNFLIKKLQDLLITNIMHTTNQQTKYFNTILFMFFERDFISFTKSFYHSKKQILNKEEKNDGKDFKLKVQQEYSDGEIEEEEEKEEEEEEEEVSKSYIMMEMSFEDSITDINIKEDSFMDLCKKLQDLNFIVISEEIFTQILFKKVFEYIETRCKGVFEKRFLKSILEWADQVIFKWLGMILLSSTKNNNNNLFDEDEDENSLKIFNQWKTRLEFSIYENYSQQRISELFDMIVQYPDSLPSFEDLSICFQKIPIEKTMITNLKRVLHNRLLHPGANTSDIITQYISTIHAMSIIDPSGMVMDKVGKPIREYLSQREDTIRCIISSFTDETNEIYQELCDYDPQDDDYLNSFMQNGASGGDLYVDEGDNFSNDDFKIWNPNKIDGSGSGSGSGNSNGGNNNNNIKKKDTISHLVNIYDSIDLFINEYRSMLSDRLLSVVDFDLDKEIKNVELLKLRFGDTILFNCEIMIKDMADSKRLNTQIKNSNNELKEFETLILSQLFWPTLKGDEFKYPKSIQEKMNLYSKEYERIKTPRQLIWKQHLGLVDLDLEIGSGNIQSFQVSPIHATLIMLFETNNDNDDDEDDEKELTLEYLSNQLGISKELARKKLIFWLNNQIIRETSHETYQIINKEKEEKKQKQQQIENPDQDIDESSSDDEDNMVVVEEEEEEKSTSAKEKEEQMRVVESFIIGMLINFKTLPLERIHSMLTMFNSEVYTSSIQELKAFLCNLTNEEKIEMVGNDYKIKK
ncbi:hypothetical protein RB653_002709 [Dictyostelium firmibasis]|uniref:Anaphase-promoting complex subunit 2 n=1 Tax=Dictyostelium firmibasis TaxID=79012 RepID=A0AAN7YSZ2_9MYCE